MNYEIIKDENKLIDFVNWLPELEEDEKYYCCLFSRKKYAPGNSQKSDKSQIKRFLSDKERLIDKIKQLEVKKGVYKIFGKEVLEESLALYINPNPRNLRTATYDGIIKLTEQLKKGNRRCNPHAEMLSCIQRSASRKIYLDFDIDQKPFDFGQLDTIINQDCLDIIETRGGFHLLVRVKDIANNYKSSFFNAIKSLGVDQTGDQLLPVPGCIQGGFVPRFIKLDSLST